jgi:hypothetical protein
VPDGISLVTFHCFGLSIFLAIAQAVFMNKLLTELAHYAPQVNSRELLQQRTSAARSFVDPADLGPVLFAYNQAITNTFYVATAAAACGFIANMFMSGAMSSMMLLPKRKRRSLKAEWKRGLIDGFDAVKEPKCHSDAAFYRYGSLSHSRLSISFYYTPLPDHRCHTPRSLVWQASSCQFCFHFQLIKTLRTLTLLALFKLLPWLVLYT